MANRLRVILLGAPGSGKGTIGKRIVNNFKLKHFAVGDLLRNHIENKTEIGAQVKQFVTSGGLVPDEFISKLVINELKSLSKNDWLLDGFPRTIAQAHALNSLKLEAVVNLNVPFEEIVNRLKHRWIHPSSGRVYNLEFNPPKVANKDDVTGENLVQREDDKPETVLKRLKLYEEQTKPIIEHYKSKNLLVTFNGRTSDFLWPFVRAHLYNLRPSDLKEPDTLTHTGQKFDLEDPKVYRFEKKAKLVNQRFAIDLISQDPIVVANQRFVWSHSGGPLGHPKVYINLDPPNEVQVCGYSGRKFIQKKFYDEKLHGKSISYDEYLHQMENNDVRA